MVDLSGLKVHDAAQRLSDDTWTVVKTWPYFDQNTLGKQIVRSADSVRANIAEGHGRFTFKEKIRFCHIARGSLVEYRSHLQSASRRHLVTPEQYQDMKDRVDHIGRMLNGFIRYLKSQTKHP